MSGVHSHTSTMTTAMNAVPLWASISGADSPRSWKSGSVTPTPESRISRHMTPTTTGAIVIGRMRPTRIEPAPAELARDEHGQSRARAASRW